MPNNNKIINISSSISILKGKPDLTPLVDVIFILLIFLLLSSSFIEVTGINVDLPKTELQHTESVGRFIIAINGEKQFFINDQPVKTLEDLKEKVVEWKNQFAPKRIMIRADQKTPFGVIAKIMAMMESLNLNVFVATLPIEEKKKDIMDD